MSLRKIVSGAQTGVDMGALDAAIESSFAFGGYTPKGRLWEADGQIPDRYFSTNRSGSGLVESSSSRYALRTRLNVKESDATLLAKVGKMTPGSKLTFKQIRQYEKPYLTFDPFQPSQIPRVVRWIVLEEIEVLNVAGPRESSRPGIQQQTQAFISSMLWHVYVHQKWGIRIWDRPKRTK